MTDASNADVILQVEDVTKVYPGTVALKGVNFSVRRGAVNVLVGENGAGKSTLMKIIAGAEQPTSGKLVLDGKPVAPASSAEALRLGIGIVFQELNLFPNLTIAENIFIAHEITRGGIDIDADTQREKVRALLARLELDLSPDTLVEDLRIGQQQLVEIAKALAHDARARARTPVEDDQAHGAGPCRVGSGATPRQREAPGASRAMDAVRSVKFRPATRTAAATRAARGRPPRRGARCPFRARQA
jgi:ABC-type lipoprotein export system ATPase subunit